MTQPSSLELTDDAFLDAFHHGQLGRFAFLHRAHLRLAWLLVRRLGVERAVEHVTSGIRSLAGTHGQPALYHDTLTRAWVYCVAAAVQETPDVPDFDGFLDAHPELLDKQFLLRYYSAARLASPQARAGWLAPDLEPIPGAPRAPSSAPIRHIGPPPLPLSAFHEALEHLPLPVAVLAAHDATRVHAVTVSSVATVAHEPVMLTACLRRDSRVLPIVRAAEGFAISYLGSGQLAIATRFADRARGEDVAQFGGVPHVRGPFGAPIVTGGPAWFECRLQKEIDVADHLVVCGSVVAAGMSDVPPLQRLHGAWT